MLRRGRRRRSLDERSSTTMYIRTFRSAIVERGSTDPSRRLAVSCRSPTARTQHRKCPLLYVTLSAPFCLSPVPPNLTHRKITAHAHQTSRTSSTKTSTTARARRRTMAARRRTGLEKTSGPRRYIVPSVKRAARRLGASLSCA